jgi:two-component system, chemotaxis family, chemotaxis protein CheY
MASMRRVLAIDDSLTIRKLLEMALGRAGYTLDLASTGQEGIQRAIRTPPDLILLDYVLPDMKGLDVASALWRDERTAAVPVVVMSAKSNDLRPLFRELPSVVEFVGKPFTPSAIVFLVADLLARGHATPAPASGAAPDLPVFTFAQKEAAAKAMFAHLRERFARIPEWMRTLGDGSPAPFFARKILTPELLDGILGGLVPTVREVLGTSASATRPAAAPGSPFLAGHTSILPLSHLLRELATTGRSGTLRLEHEARATWLFLRRGRVVLVTHDQPDESVRQSAEDLSSASASELDQATAAQRASGKPVFATLAESGRFPATDLAQVLYQHGKRAFLAAIEAGPGAFDWSESQELPGYVEAFGRPLALEQVQLERLRAVDDWAQVELHVSGLDVVFHRVEDFAVRFGGFELVDSERRVLTLVDDRNSVRQIIDRSGLTPFEVFHCLFRLGQVGLVAARSTSLSSEEPAHAARPVAILDPDREGVKEPLARLLAQRQTPVPLLDVPTPDDIIALCLKERPRLLILNVSVGFDAAAAARQVRGTLEISDTALVAVSDREIGRLGEDLVTAGFDAVLVKPFLFTDIERLLAA